MEFFVILYERLQLYTLILGYCNKSNTQTKIYLTIISSQVNEQAQFD